VHGEGLDAALCGALSEDADPGVCAAAASLMKGTRDPEQLACLGARLAVETDPQADAAVLDALESSGAPEAADALCKGIAPWVKAHVTDQVPEDAAGILRAQNDRDPDHSYDCAATAMKQAGGFTCHGREYVATFYKDVGGKVGVPDCDGKRKSSGGASNEVSFE
jgi:hypothetical protein